MGNLKERLKATLLRRDSSRRLSPTPSKNSSGREYNSSASTQSQPGYDASDERSDHKVRGSSGRSVSQDRAANRSGSRLVDNRDNDKSHTPAGSAAATPGCEALSAPAFDSAHSDDRLRDNKSAHVTDDNSNDNNSNKGDRFEAEKSESSTMAQGPSLVPARVNKGAKVKVAAPPTPRAGAAQDGPQALAMGPPELAPTTNIDATAQFGNDLRRLALNSRSGSATIKTAPTSSIVVSPTTATASTTTATATATDSSSFGAGGDGSAGSGSGSGAGAGIIHATSTVSTTTAAATATRTTNVTAPAPPNTNTTTTAATSTSAALPSIHEHPATPPTLPSTNPESEATSPDPRAHPVHADAEYAHAHDNISINPIDDLLHNPSLLTPPLASSFRPPLSPSSSRRPLGPPRRQSILPAHQTNFVRALLQGNAHDFELDFADSDPQDPLFGMVTTRKIWVKRPVASATQITINEDDLVDDVREQILRKYANSLGRQYDAPDLTLRICNREQQTSRSLQPDESICKVIDSYYTNGQGVDDALLIDIPSRRTPKASPNPRFYADDRPHESGTDYFPPYPPPTHAHHSVTAALLNGQHPLHFPPSMSIVGGNQLPPLPSPGSSRRLPTNRPTMQRMHTASPISTVPNSHASQTGATSTGTTKYPRPVRSRTHSGASSDQSIHPPAAPPIPTPPPVERIATPPPPRVASPLQPGVKKKRGIETPTLPLGLLNTAVPPINILIVEDNMINLRLLEAFVKRLKVRWQTAVNGREAVDKWRAGGFHLVLMDIQLPIMSGLEATREIRRIEKVNSIGVFSSSASSPPDEVLPEPADEDKLANTEMFKSPVIIVALTASSLQSDRHEALAAGCNDFLTKPVNFEWLQRKVKEWGCMQALIDFDGWRRWKDFSQKTEASETAKKIAAASKAKLGKKNRLSMTAAA
ncbi:hypothetical protein GGR51DRAFT_519025 [Nemania sp. FL0031]|nr:hypothetical protein GGR51DRAFT_519025 [Nemania sp. FL0031]